MKKLIPALIAAILIAVIGVLYLIDNDYRIIVDDSGNHISKRLNVDNYVDKLLENKYVIITEGDSKDTYTFKDVGITAEVIGLRDIMFTQDQRNLAVLYSVSEDSILYSINDERTEKVDGSLSFDEDGNIYIKDAVDANIVNTGLLIADLKVMLSWENNDSIIVKLEDYYTEFGESDYYIQMLVSKQILEDFCVSYSNGFNVTSNVLAKRGLLQINEDGTITCTAELSDARDICGKNLTGYNSIGVVEKFKTHDGKDISVESKTYGNYIDYEKEGEYLLNLIKEFKSEKDRTPIMKQEALHSIDTTYIEVDKTQQHVYYYIDGELVWDSDVVTGLPNGKRDTPSGIYFIINKAKNTRLKGETWDVKVDRWMAVTYSGVGFHDASWRSNFGGNIYKTNGSHGCINTPKDKMYELWDMVEVGTPVVIY